MEIQNIGMKDINNRQILCLIGYYKKVIRLLIIKINYITNDSKRFKNFSGWMRKC